MKLKAPEGCGGVSFDGQAYPVVDGQVDVPEAAAAELTQPGWGFSPEAAPEAAPAAKAGKK